MSENSSLIIGNFDPLKKERFQVLNENGEVVRPEYMPDLSNDEIKNLLKKMILARTADQKALKLQRSGRIGTFAEIIGQEASHMGPISALKKEDWLVPAFREMGAYVLMDIPLSKFFLLYGGSEEGNRMPEEVNCLPVSVPVGSQTLHAVGISWGAKIKKEKIVAMTFLGDGGTSEGDFHEAMNFAGVLQTPTVFVCQNNQYAISTPRSRQTRAETIAQKAIAYGFDGIQVDGNDVFATYAVAKEAVEKARNGGGPTLIESVTYRLGAHTTSDDPTLYRDDAEVEKMWKFEPIARVKNYLKAQGALTDEEFESFQKEADEIVAAEVKAFEETLPQEMETMISYTYEKTPAELTSQLSSLKENVNPKFCENGED